MFAKFLLDKERDDGEIVDKNLVFSSLHTIRESDRVKHEFGISSC